MPSPSANEFPQYTYCPKCGYDLCGLTGVDVTCPECGHKHAESVLLDPRVSAERVRAIKRAINILTAFLWALSLAAFGAARAGVWQIAVVVLAEFAVFGFLLTQHGSLNLKATLPRKLDRRCVLAAAILLFLRQFAWLVLPGAALLVLLAEFPHMRSRFWAFFGLFLILAGAALYDALTFGVIPERRTWYHRFLAQLKHRAGDRTVAPEDRR